MEFDQEKLDILLDRAIEEDIRSGDITTQACVPPNIMTSGKLRLKQRGVVAGLDFVKRLFEKVNPKIVFNPLVEEGPILNAGTIIAKVSGPAQSILTGERIALNLLRHTSGVATITAAYVKKVRGLNCSILDTRKTLPGLRQIEKHAVMIGGGVVHRWGLDDMFIIKSNHLAYLAAESPHPITEAVDRVRFHHPEIPIEIEIVHFDQLDEVLNTDIATIMLDNMRPDEVSRCVRKIRQHNKTIKVYLESSGAITLETIRMYAETGVDGIAVTALTHSVQALEIGMRLLI